MTLLPALALLALAPAALPGPLVQRLEAARRHNHALGISRAQLAEQEAAVQQALSALTPTLQASGNYTRNEYQAVFAVPSNLFGTGPKGSTTTLTIQPYNAVTGSVGIALPLVVPQGLERYAELRHARESARAGARASEAEVLLSTARAYYAVVGAQGVVDAALEALATAQANLRVSETKLSAGTANRLAVDRAEVDVARAAQTLATSRQTLALALRNVETLTGERVEGPFPPPGAPEAPTRAEADLVAEAERQRPELAQLRETQRQAELAVDEAWLQLAPTLVGSAQEHYTNAPGFIPADSFWTAGVTLAWTVDPVGAPAAARRARAALEEARQRLAQEQDAVRDEVHSAWLDADADRARLDEASSELQSAKEALAITQEQYQAGTATSLDLSQAERDAFESQATLAQSRANLAAALLSLRKAAGEPLLAMAEGDAP